MSMTDSYVGRHRLPDNPQHREPAVGFRIPSWRECVDSVIETNKEKK
jgi:hypothetical protein